jgi:hypothetical protein
MPECVQNCCAELGNWAIARGNIMIVRFLKIFAKCCDFIDRVLVRFVGERLIVAILAFIFIWCKYYVFKLRRRAKL